MRYRLTCLSPVLVGDGSHLAPIDYMVWRGHVNVLDQNRIFRLLAKGPRLENYLKQIRRADKLDFASWGGFAQNFAGRRIPFEHPSYAAYWEKLSAEHLRIPTFVSSPSGPYLPGSALKGALRTAYLSQRVTPGVLKDLAARANKEKGAKPLGALLEERLAGNSWASHLKPFAVGDSAPVERTALKIFLVRTATLAPAGPGKLALRWRQAPRGSVDGSRPEASTPLFAEMAAPGSVFEGRWRENGFYQRAEVARALRWRSPLTTKALMEAANTAAERLLQIQLRYAEVAGLDLVRDSVRSILARLEEARGREACVVCLGWGGGFLSKSAGGNTAEETHRQILAQLSYYSRAIRSGLPFPKTRRIVFLEDRPAAFPGWALVEIG